MTLTFETYHQTIEQLLELEKSPDPTPEQSAQMTLMREGIAAYEALRKELGYAPRGHDVAAD